MILRGLTVVVVDEEVLPVVVAVATVVAGAAVVDVPPPPPPPPATVVVELDEVVVVGADEIVKEIDAEVADAYGLLAAMEAEIVHVPASTKETAPVELLIVQIEAVELEYDFEPPPADAVDVIVGGVALPP